MHPAIENLIKSGRVEKGLYWQMALRLTEGCTKVSQGCLNCWSETQCNIRSHNPAMIHQYPPEVLTGGKFNGKVRFLEQNLDILLKRKKPTVFALWNDLFHEGIKDHEISYVFYKIQESPQHIIIILTKRIGRAKQAIDAWRLRRLDGCSDKKGIRTFPRNIWLGTTAENQEQADKRIPVLLQIPAAKRVVSIEPLLGAIDLSNALYGYAKQTNRNDTRISSTIRKPETIDGVICGGESGLKARPMHPDWVRWVRDQCMTADVPFFFKQWGEWMPHQSTQYKRFPNKAYCFIDFEGRQLLPGNGRWGRLLPSDKFFIKAGKKPPAEN